jgi:hypothetical protein
MPDQSIESFWNWFTVNASRFDNQSTTDDFIAELDDRILDIGDFTWEVGPGIHKEYQLVISPHGDKDLLKQTRNIVAMAPVLDQWEFYPARQPLQGSPIFILHTDKGDVSFDASNWQYILYKFPDNTFDIVLKASTIQDFSPTDQAMAACLAIDGIIGEELRIAVFVEIEVVKEFEEGEKPGAPTLPNLLDHLKQLLKDHL